MEQCKAAFEDLLARLQTDYIDLGMIHFIDSESDWDAAMNGPYLDYVKELKAARTIRHIGMSTHNPAMARRAAEHGLVEMLLFSVNPAFDMHPATDDLASMQPDVPATVKAHYDALEHHADECVGCRSCESRCPFGVEIAARMEKAAELFQN